MGLGWLGASPASLNAWYPPSAMVIKLFNVFCSCERLRGERLGCAGSAGVPRAARPPAPQRSVCIPPLFSDRNRGAARAGVVPPVPSTLCVCQVIADDIRVWRLDTLMAEATQQGFDFPCLITARLLGPGPALPRDAAACVGNRAGAGRAAQALPGSGKITLAPALPQPGSAEKDAAPEFIY